MMAVSLVFLLFTSPLPAGPIVGTITHQDGPITQVAGSSSTEESRSGGESIPLYSLLTGPQDEHHFAIDITCLGDVDGDGNDDMVIGYHLGDRDTAGVPSDWGNYILRGRADHEYTLTQLEEMDAMSTRWQVHGNRWLGDVNGDGLSDMVSFVKTQWREWNDAGQPTSPGYIDIRYGEPGGISRDPSVSIPWKVPTRDDSTRWEMPLYGGVGDVNGDGYDDMCIIDGEDLELFEGSAQGIALSPSSTTVLETPEDAHDRWTWYRDLRHGDVNGDGHSDIVIGDIAGPWLTVYYGSADGVDGTPHSTDFIRYNNNIGIHSPVDVNGDGYDDVVIELSGRDSAGYHLEIEVFEGSPEGLPSNASKRFGILHGEFFHFFRNILFADINGDSLDDILYEHENTGNWTRDEETKNLTRYSVYINTGGAYPAAPHYEFEIEGHFESYAWSRHGLNAVGDFDGDGLEDVAFGIPDGTAYSWDPHTDPIRPGHVLIIHGGGIMQRISDITVIGKTTLYAAHSEGEIVANLVPLEGQGAILGASITLDPGGADVTIEWDPTASGNPFRIIEDHLGCIGLNSTAEDVETDAATGAPRPHFRFVPGWEWPHEGPCTVALTIETETGQVGPLPSPGLFNVVTTVEFQGPPTIRGHGNRLIEDGDWVRAGEQVNMTDLVLVYSGSDDIEANLSGSMMATDNDGDASERPLGPNWLWHLSFFMDNETDKDEVLTISAKNLTGNAELKEVLTVRLPVDGDLPTIGNPVPDDQDWHAIFSVLISITASDTNGSGVEPLSLEYSWRTRNASAWSDWSREGLVVSTQGDQAEGLVTLQLRNGDENQVRWRARDLVGNGPAEVLQTIKVDTLNVSFADPFPDPDEWSLETTVSCGATITDLEGSGIDITTVQYRVSPRNLSQYGEWTDWDEGDIGDGRSVSTRVDVDLANSGRNYVQWRAMDIAGNGYTTSPHYRVRVDVTAPVFEEFSPGPDEFQTHTDVDCEVVVHDNALGSGVDLSSVQYRYSLNGSTPHWSDWTDAGMTGVADSARFSVVLAFSHGADNRVQFRCSDVAGNGPVESDEYHVAVDIEPPVILWIEPAEDEKQPGVTVNVRMAVRDDLSGFGPDSILCAYGTDGTVPTIPEYPLDDVEHDNGTLIGSTWLDLAPGVDNVVRFWVYDVVGNEAVSDVVSIWVNRPPVAVITSPSNGTTIWDTEELILKGGNSTDPDGDPLDYTWLLEGSPLANGEVADLSLEPGSYNITLVVSDDDGAEGRATVTVTVEEWVQPHTSEEPFDDWLLLLFLLVLVLTIVGALIWRTRVTERQGG